MPLRITIELVPHGDEGRKRRFAVLDIENDGTADACGGGSTGNYWVRTFADCGEAGWDDLEDLRVAGVPRLIDGQRFYLGTAAACLSAVSQKIALVSPPQSLSLLREMAAPITAAWPRRLESTP